MVEAASDAILELDEEPYFHVADNNEATLARQIAENDDLSLSFEKCGKELRCGHTCNGIKGA